MADLKELYGRPKGAPGVDLAVAVVAGYMGDSMPACSHKECECTTLHIYAHVYTYVCTHVCTNVHTQGCGESATLRVELRKPPPRSARAAEVAIRQLAIGQCCV